MSDVFSIVMLIVAVAVVVRGWPKLNNQDRLKAVGLGAGLILLIAVFVVLIR